MQRAQPRHRPHPRADHLLPQPTQSQRSHGMHTPQSRCATITTSRVISPTPSLSGRHTRLVALPTTPSAHATTAPSITSTLRSIRSLSLSHHRRRMHSTSHTPPTTTTTTSNSPHPVKPSLAQPIADEYNPLEVEATWDQYWESHDLYKPNPLRSTPFSMVLPPPNVTGSLHLGHALTVAIQDSIVRYQRMNGKDVLWVPGVDHAGIATQVVVEKQLQKNEGLSRHDLGRDAFVQKIWEWKNAFGGKIFDQMRHLGASVDWSRQRFTLDPMCQRAVREAFTQLHAKDVIYRDNRLVTWSCALKSAISSIEVDHVDITAPTTIKVPGYDKEVEVGVIHSFAYKVKDSPTDEEIIVATTRIETMLGDVAVAVHPDDPRYTHLHYKHLMHPFDSTREVVVIPDGDLVDMAFGTGAVKITPGHDPNDYACGLRHGLPQITILTDDGHMNDAVAQPYRGKHRFAVREAIIGDLAAAGLYRGKEPHTMAISVCSRSGDLIEPLIKPQWWVRCDNMAQRGLDAVASGELTILPQSGVDAWKRWLGNTQDWCISRQLWWGHRIPAYYVLPEGEAWPIAPDREDRDRWIIASSEEDAMRIAQERFPQPPSDAGSASPHKRWTLHQDEDVLDTWFSSGLFPFAVMGWPDTSPRNEDFHRYFPNKLLETGSDILFFWVARMVMMSQELTGKLPFDTVYLHSLVRDKFGRKMSKSLGNVIDPLDVINGVSLERLAERLAEGNLPAHEIAKVTANQRVEFPQGIPQCGADGLRFGLLTYTKQGGDINLDMNVITSARHFGNKMWQATRFALQNFPAEFVPPHRGLSDVQRDIALTPGGITFEQQWILNKLHHTVQRVHDAYERYEFGQATQALQTFFVDDLCARYLEVIKPIVRRPPAASFLSQGEGGEGAHASHTTTPPASHYDPAAAQSALSVLHYSMDCFFRLLHPMMPFITEELWRRLPGHAALHRDSLQGLFHVEYAQDTDLNSPYHAVAARHGSSGETDTPSHRPIPRTAKLSDLISENKRLQSGSIMVAAFPQTEDLAVYHSPSADATMGLLTTIVDRIRAVKARLGLPNHYHPRVFLECNENSQSGGGDKDSHSHDTTTTTTTTPSSSTPTLLHQLTSLRRLISTLAFVSPPEPFHSADRHTVIPPGTTTIRQFISSDVALHIVLDPSIDFSAELVKNERKHIDLTQLKQTLLVTITRTQDNPKVKDEVKQKNQATLTQYNDELAMLEENIAAYRQVVTKENYTREKRADLMHEREVLEKTKEKMTTLIANAKKPSPKHVDALKQCEHQIALVQSQLDSMDID